MQRGLKKLSLLSVLFILLFLCTSVNAIDLDRACGIVLKDRLQVIVKFETNGGEEMHDLNYCSNCGSAGFKLPTPVRKGHKFVGWYADSKFTKKLDTVYKKTEVGDILTFLPYSRGCSVDKIYTTIYAKWELDESCEIPSSYNVKINFNSKDGSDVKPIEFNTGDELNQINLSIPSRDGYTFLGWYSEEEYKTLMPNDTVEVNELYSKMKLKSVSNDNCSFDKQGTLYARWADEQEILYLVIDNVDNNVFMINDLFN